LIQQECCLDIPSVFFLQFTPSELSMHHLSLLLLMMMALCLQVEGWATADGPDYYQVTGVADTDRLVIRAQASPKARAVGLIPNGSQCLRNLGCQGGLTYQEFTTLTEKEKAKRQAAHPRWCRIEYQGVRGWVNARYLREGNCSP